MPTFVNYDSDNPTPSSRRLSGRQRSMDSDLGRKVADILLWKNKKLTTIILAGFTTIWFLFEVVEYSAVTLLCHICIIGMLSLFILSNWAVLIKRAPLCADDIRIPESVFSWFYNKLNWLLKKFYYISSGKDMSIFLMAIGTLWVLSIIGNYFSSLNMLYLGFLALATIPVLYQRYEEEVDYLASRGRRDMKRLYVKFDSNVLNKIPRGPVKEKKKY